MSDPSCSRAGRTRYRSEAAAVSARHPRVRTLMMFGEAVAPLSGPILLAGGTHPLQVRKAAVNARRTPLGAHVCDDWDAAAPLFGPPVRARSASVTCEKEQQ